MELFIAENAGFCFGVKNAVDMVKEALNDGEVITLGPIIHNSSVVGELAQMGVKVIENIEDIVDGSRVVIRSHGISKGDFERLREKNIEIIDATCPNVNYIHKIVGEKYNEGFKIIIIGDENHPEVKGINGWCSDSAIILDNIEDIKEKIPTRLNKACIISQTTFSFEKWKSIVANLFDLAKEVYIYNTICNATELRQRETENLSKKVSLMIVIGGKNSSNTRKLYDICVKNTNNVIFIEKAEELETSLLEGFESIGITAGASTPKNEIEAVVEKINEIKNENMGEELNKMEIEIKDEIESKEETENKDEIEAKEETENIDEIKEAEEGSMKYYMDSMKNIYTGSIVKGKILRVSSDEAFVDIGYKADGILPLSEMSDPSISLLDRFKEGDIIEVEVIKLNDGEGNVVLSRKAVDKEEFIERLKGIKESNSDIEVVVRGRNKGGFEVNFMGMRAFMPYSCSMISKEDEKDYTGEKFKARILEIEEGRKGLDIVVSRREIIEEEKQKRIVEFLDEISEGKIIEGRVRGIIKGGIFIDTESIDVFVPASEISYKRNVNPFDYVKVGEKLKVIIIKADKENKRITGSIKRLMRDPWEVFMEKHKEGETITGEVVSLTDYGAFVEVVDGVDGLVHISAISEKRIAKPKDVLGIGQKVKVKIMGIDLNNKKISLSMRDAE